MVRESVAAVAAKTARACDICVRKRARWYCASDDAFLCHHCDVSVHSANPLAARHDRIRLNHLPSWNRGPTKKPRTPRPRKSHHHHHPIVPEIDTCSNSIAEEEEEENHLLYRVPVYDHQTDFEFAADVEALLGKEEDELGLADLGLLLSTEEFDERREEEIKKEVGLGFELTFDYDSPVVGLDDEMKEMMVEQKLMLKLDYDAISRDWGKHGLPWLLTGDTQILHSWSCDSATVNEVKPYGEVTKRSGGREARVSRYREKRKTRLFSKKIRYEVRKLNAEKRPRMKGRFVKRSSSPLITK